MAGLGAGTDPCTCWEGEWGEWASVRRGSSGISARRVFVEQGKTAKSQMSGCVKSGSVADSIVGAMGVQMLSASGAAM